MTKVENNPNPGEAQNPEPQAPEPQAPNPAPSTDPLDALSDTEALRAEAKKFRAIANRRTEKPEEQKPEPTPFLTKEDALRMNAKTARTLVSEEIQGNWDTLLEYVPAKFQKAETPQEIAEGMKLAHAAWLTQNPPRKENPGADLTRQPNVRSGGPSQAPNPEKKGLPYEKSSPMSDWYKKPE